MRSSIACRAFPAILATLSLSCGSAERKPDPAVSDSAAAKAAAEMAAMPGMGAQDSGAATSDTVSLTAAQVAHGNVRWGQATPATIVGSVTIPGEVVPNEDRTARLGAPARGRVVTVHVTQGDRVRRGSPLVTLESAEAGAAQSDLAKAKAQLSSAQAQASYAASARARAERLLSLTAIPRQELERAVADDSLAQAMLHQAESELLRAQSAARAIGADEASPGRMVLRSPVDGVVLLRTAVPGSVVEAGAPLAAVSDLTTLWVTASAPEGLSDIRRGAAIRFSVPAIPGESFNGKIEAVGPGLDAATRTLPLRASVNNRDGRLRPEMLATITVDGTSHGEGVSLPDDAVQLLAGRTAVFVVTPDGKGGAQFAARTVVVASRSGGKAVVATGLAASDIVVLHGAFAVKAQLQKGSMPDMEM
ncbi:MAG: efflux RND transporter periplasmic adaptor subunit [Gemmatimonadota bacterium]